MATPLEKSPTGFADEKGSAVANIAALTATSASDDSSDDEYGALAKNPFLDPDIATHWRQAYDNAQYECRHVFDPTLTWTEEEEKRVIRKIDWRICAWAVCAYHKRGNPSSDRRETNLTPLSSVCDVLFSPGRSGESRTRIGRQSA